VLVLLPPSETKRTGGEPGSRLRLPELRYPSLNRQRRQTLAAVRSLARDHEASVTALRLGPRQHDEVAKNRRITSSPTMPAVDRYTGVLYDALDASSLPAASREYLGEHVTIHSAVLGPVGALDAIPDYRLSHDSRIPGIRLRALWAEPVGRAIASAEGLIIDARSESYAALGPSPAHAVFLRVVTETPDGAHRALNHFNKHAKGAFVRALAEDLTCPADVPELIDWAAQRSIRLERVDPGELLLFA
jgi:Uncharacterized protein conserved in bacteria